MCLSVIRCSLLSCSSNVCEGEPVPCFIIGFYFIHFSRLNSISLKLFWENTGSASETIKYSKFHLVISVCNLTLLLTLPYFLKYVLPYLTLPHVLPYITLHFTLHYLTSYLTLPYHTLCLTLPFYTLP